MMQRFAQPWVAMLFGAFIVGIEACDHFDSIVGLPKTWPDLPLYDWIAGILLVWTAVLSRRDWTMRREYQTVAWAFMSSLLIGSVYGHLGDWLTRPSSANTDSIPRGALVGILIALNAIALCGLIGTLTARDRQFST